MHQAFVSYTVNVCRQDARSKLEERRPLSTVSTNAAPAAGSALLGLLSSTYEGLPRASGIEQVPTSELRQLHRSKEEACLSSRSAQLAASKCVTNWLQVTDSRLSATQPPQCRAGPGGHRAVSGQQKVTTASRNEAASCHQRPAGHPQRHTQPAAPARDDQPRLKRRRWRPPSPSPAAEPQRPASEQNTHSLAAPSGAVAAASAALGSAGADAAGRPCPFCDRVLAPQEWEDHVAAELALADEGDWEDVVPAARQPSRCSFIEVPCDHQDSFNPVA